MPHRFDTAISKDAATAPIQRQLRHSLFQESLRQALGGGVDDGAHLVQLALPQFGDVIVILVELCVQRLKELNGRIIHDFLFGQLWWRTPAFQDTRLRRNLIG